MREIYETPNKSAQKEMDIDTTDLIPVENGLPDISLDQTVEDNLEDELGGIGEEEYFEDD